MRASWGLLGWPLLACRVDDVPSGADSGVGRDPVCDAIVEGTWTASGAPFGMVMDATVTFDAAACTFSTTDWNFNGAPMSHSSEMWGGVVDGDRVVAYGSTDFWDSCAGTLDEGGAHLAGTCADAEPGSDSFELSLKD